MSAEHEVAALPGGAALAALAHKVSSACPAEVRDTADRWRRAAEACADGDAAISESVTKVNGSWTGTDAGAFTSYMTGFRKRGDTVVEVLTTAADRLEQAATALETARTSTNRVLEDLLTRVRRSRQSHNQPDHVDQTIAGWCQEATGDVQAVISEADEVLRTALAELDRAPDAVRHGFSTLPPPNGHAFPEAPPAKSAPSDTHVSSAGPAPAPAPAHHTPSSQPSGGAHHAPPSDGGTGGGHGGLGSSGGPPSSSPPPGKVEDWIREAIKELQKAGVPVTEANIDEIWKIIEKESSGNPHAINLWDSNAQAGTPSKGLMQCIDSTFQAHKLPGHDDIWNPVDNIIAGVRYTFDRYGGFDSHPGLRAMAQGGGYQGY